MARTPNFEIQHPKNLQKSFPILIQKPAIMPTFSNTCKSLFSFFIIVKTATLAAQSLAPTLLTPAGNLEISSDGSSLSWSVGEIAVLHEVAADGNWLTQGFQQPDSARVDTSKTVRTSSSVIIPEGLAANQFFEPLLDKTIADLQTAELQIFNRWSERVYFESSLSPRWDGKNSGGAAFPEGAYFYILTLRKTDGSSEVFEKGALNVLRKR